MLSLIRNLKVIPDFQSCFICVEIPDTFFVYLLFNKNVYNYTLSFFHQRGVKVCTYRYITFLSCRLKSEWGNSNKFLRLIIKVGFIFIFLWTQISGLFKLSLFTLTGDKEKFFSSLQQSSDSYSTIRNLIQHLVSEVLVNDNCEIFDLHTSQQCSILKGKGLIMKRMFFIAYYPQKIGLRWKPIETNQDVRSHLGVIYHPKANWGH